MLRMCFAIFFFFFNDTAPTEIYTSVHTLSLHDALPISPTALRTAPTSCTSRRWRMVRSEEHTSELQSRTLISYAVFCLKKKKIRKNYSDIRLYTYNLNKNIIYI